MAEPVFTVAIVATSTGPRQLPQVRESTAGRSVLLVLHPDLPGRSYLPELHALAIEHTRGARSVTVTGCRPYVRAGLVKVLRAALGPDASVTSDKSSG